MSRIDRDTLNLQIARLVARRSTCNRAHAGCVISIAGRIVVTGYNGSPAGLPHCSDVGCEIGPDGGCITTVHAEAGAISFAARKGLALETATVYLTMSPCRSCAKLLINAGVYRVVYDAEYRDRSGISLLRQAGIEVQHQPLSSPGLCSTCGRELEPPEILQCPYCDGSLIDH